MSSPSSLFNRLVKYHTRFSVGIALYGFTRGLRIQINAKNKDVSPPILTGHRLVHGVGTACIYCIPGWNMMALFRLLNRMEIHYNGWNRYDFLEEYREVGGYCMDTL